MSDIPFYVMNVSVLVDYLGFRFSKFGTLKEFGIRILENITLFGIIAMLNSHECNGENYI